MESSFNRRLPATSAGSHTEPLDGSTGLKSTDRAAREEILHAARALWERKGRPENMDLAIWLEAEAAVLKGGRQAGK